MNKVAILKSIYNQAFSDELEKIAANSSTGKKVFGKVINAAQRFAGVTKDVASEAAKNVSQATQKTTQTANKVYKKNVKPAAKKLKNVANRIIGSILDSEVGQQTMNDLDEIAREGGKKFRGKIHGALEDVKTSINPARQASNAGEAAAQTAANQAASHAPHPTAPQAPVQPQASVTPQAPVQPQPQQTSGFMAHVKKHPAAYGAAATVGVGGAGMMLGSAFSNKNNQQPY